LSAVIVVLAVLAFLFFIQMYWSNKLDQAGYLGSLYKDSLEQIEYKRLSSEYVKRFSEGEYEEEAIRNPEFLKDNPKPSGFHYPMPGDPPGLGGLGGSRGPTGYTPPPSANSDFDSDDATSLSQDSAAREERRRAEVARRKEWQEQQKTVEEWRSKVIAKARENYNHDLQEAREGARKQAHRAMNVDLSALYGRGPEFVLGFTTIVVIVFAAFALGILKILKAEQIGTLFAAIAGYVLGRSTMRGAAAPEQAQTAPPGQAETKAKTTAAGHG
jgi:hypothetical protein